MTFTNPVITESLSVFTSRCVKGVCVVLDAQTYRCECEKGYRGVLCNLREEPAGSCQGLQCLHGHCQKTEDGERCVCEQGYTGESCDIGDMRGQRKDLLLNGAQKFRVY